MSWHAWVDGGRRVALGAEQVWYRVDGAGPTLLFAHGYPTSSHDFAPVIAVLAKTYRCVSFDFLGFGASSKPKRDYDYALQHQVLARVTAAADVSRAVLVAHDYAVTLGQDFLARTPSAPFVLDGVIFLNGGLDPAQHRARVIQRFLATRFGRVVGPRILGRKAVLRSLGAIFVRKDRLPADDAWEAMSSGGGIAVLPRLLHYMAERRCRRDALIASLGASTPRAFVWGMDDPVSGAHVLEAIRPHAGGAIFRELHGVGHYPQLEASDEVAAFIDATAAAWNKRA
ncbi:MAG TPA: alpha/beta fold hydrolase [Myxococcota bacterium]|nr:alpha/beta fold hydrolase [Myxococcota bacterium]